MQIAKPSAFLSPFIKQYWSIESCLPKGKTHIQKIIPNGFIELNFYLGKKPEIKSKNKTLTENSIVTGQLKDHYEIIVADEISIFSVTFKPQGAMMFFNLPMSEFFDINVPLRHLKQIKIEKIENQLYAANNFQEKIILIEIFLTNQLLKNHKAYEIARLNSTINLIDKKRGIININELAANACLSLKQFERTFNNYVGISPKRFLRIVKFQNTIYEKQLNSEKQLTQLAYDCGYYDQSHLTNDFKHLAGMTPKQFFSDCEPYSDYFSF